MEKKKRTYEDDDGRVIASMNVDGMPWYQRSSSQKLPVRNDSSHFEDLTKEETR